MESDQSEWHVPKSPPALRKDRWFGYRRPETVARLATSYPGTKQTVATRSHS